MATSVDLPGYIVRGRSPRRSEGAMSSRTKEPSRRCSSHMCSAVYAATTSATVRRREFSGVSGEYVVNVTSFPLHVTVYLESSCP